MTAFPTLSVVLNTVSCSLNLGITPTYGKSARYVKRTGAYGDHRGEESEGLVNDT